VEYFVYILESEVNGKYYIGQTEDLQERVKRHNSGKNKYTRLYIPWELRWWKKFNTRSEAVKEERKIKRIKKREGIKRYVDTNDYRGVAQPG
jgi:putative endonuclease